MRRMPWVKMIHRGSTTYKSSAMASMMFLLGHTRMTIQSSIGDALAIPSKITAVAGNTAEITVLKR